MTTPFVHLFFLIVSVCLRRLNGSCAQLGNCNGHGKCTREGTCECFDGWGSATDMTNIKAADCSARTCPSGTAWADLVNYAGEAHQLAECSNAGICNKTTGQCECFAGYSGSSCQRRECLNNCSGHGRCVPKQRAARMASAWPVNRDFTYGERGRSKTFTWDAQMEYMCICDSSWPVGSDRGQRSESEWFGRDCSLRHCPSANNPASVGIDETSCWNQTIPLNPRYPGREGSICQVDCAGQGICDYTTGTCTCFPGFWGQDCGRRVDYEEPVVVVTDTETATDDYYYFVPPDDDDQPQRNTIIT